MTKPELADLIMKEVGKRLLYHSEVRDKTVRQKILELLEKHQ